MFLSWSHGITEIFVSQTLVKTSVMIWLCARLRILAPQFEIGPRQSEHRPLTCSSFQPGWLIKEYLSNTSEGKLW